MRASLFVFCLITLNAHADLDLNYPYFSASPYAAIKNDRIEFSQQTEAESAGDPAYPAAKASFQYENNTRSDATSFAQYQTPGQVHQIGVLRLHGKVTDVVHGFLNLPLSKEENGFLAYSLVSDGLNVTTCQSGRWGYQGFGCVGVNDQICHRLGKFNTLNIINSVASAQRDNPDKDTLLALLTQSQALAKLNRDKFRVLKTQPSIDEFAALNLDTVVPSDWTKLDPKTTQKFFAMLTVFGEICFQEHDILQLEAKEAAKQRPGQSVPAAPLAPGTNR